MEVGKVTTVNHGKKLIFASLFFAVLACAALYWYLQGVNGDAMGEVVVARQAIPAYTTVQPNQLQVKKMPAAYIPATAIQLLSMTQGKMLNVSLEPGDLLAAHYLTEDKTQGGLSCMIPEGDRAMTVAVDEVSSVARLVEAGNYVDVLVYLKKDSVGKDTEQTLLQHKLVLAVDQTVQQATNNTAKASTNETKTVTLAVTPNEAQQLGLAQEIGSVRLILRPQDETTVFKGKGAVPAGLLR